MLSVFSKFITSFFESDEETLSIMRWLYLVTLCVELAASENPDGKFFSLLVFLSMFSTGIVTRKKKVALQQARCFVG